MSALATIRRRDVIACGPIRIFQAIFVSLVVGVSAALIFF
jgi:hypothetical protein